MQFGTIREALPCVSKENMFSICIIVKSEDMNNEQLGIKCKRGKNE
jgi:hypothetical protein